jgi:hypothetical protein
MLKFLIIVACIYFFFLLVGRYLFPWALRLFVKRLQKKMFGSQTEYTDHNQDDDSVHINYSPERKKTHDDSVGEYTDYEEIK